MKYSLVCIDLEDSGVINDNGKLDRVLVLVSTEVHSDEVGDDQSLGQSGFQHDQRLGVVGANREVEVAVSNLNQNHKQN